ncbi:probable G-protein coupled receptor AH9.1 [Pollicipes pollicipes]|uniref:probable G-protein coupled receptor AH9.1 n=1 Tax=Pollicipes pollicipes TaxID=41117 RepID=UPI001884E88D|nr:probable G-protein coupled receptor AH9.1 [Pollicipes pollicipes]
MWRPTVDASQPASHLHSGVLESCDRSENCTATSELAHQDRIAIIGYRYCYSAISAVGVCGSLMLLLTLRHACFRSSDVYTYLRCLMLSDCALLVLSGATLHAESWQSTISCDGRNVSVRTHVEAAWHILWLPLTNALIGLSMAVTLWMTYDRYVAVRSPRDLLRQPRSAQRCGDRMLRIVASLAVSLLLHSPLILGYTVVHHCPDGRHDFYELKLKDSVVSSPLWTCYQWVLQLLVRWLPATIVLFCNCSIIVAISRRSRRNRRTRAADHAVFRLGADVLSEGGGTSSQPRSTRLTSEARSVSQATGGSCCREVRQRQKRRQDTENRLEFLLAAMAVSCLVSNCMQSVVIILDMAYDESHNFYFQMYRAIGNNVEALHFSLDPVFAIAFVKQIREIVVCKLGHLGSTLRWLLLIPQSASTAN